MKVKQVIEVVREWVDVRGRELPGFVGAHLMGSINHMSADAEFPAYKDVDMHILADGSHQMVDLLHRGLYLECAIGEPERYATPEVVLADPETAPNLAVDSVILDPTGRLSELQQAVARDFAQRRWIVARCNAEKEWAEAAFAEATRQTTSEAAWAQLGWMINFLSGLLACANLTSPTHRRCLIVMGDVLREQGRPDLLEALFDLWGIASLTRREVEACLADCAAMFDLATAVTKTPVPFQFKLQPFVRPYVVDGAQEMIDEGYWREAMFWIALFTMVAHGAIQADAAEADKAASRAMYAEFLSKLGWAEAPDLSARLGRARSVMDEVFAVAGRIVDQRASNL